MDEIIQRQKTDAQDHYWMSQWLGEANYNKSDIYACLQAGTFQRSNALRTAETREKLFSLIDGKPSSLEDALFGAVSQKTIDIMDLHFATA